MSERKFDNPLVAALVSKAESASDELYQVGYAAGYAKAQAEHREFVSLYEMANAIVAKQRPEVARASEAVENEAVESQPVDSEPADSSRAPYGSIRLAILKALKGCGRPMRPAEIHSAIVSMGYSFAKVNTIRSTLHKMCNDDGYVKNTGEGWVAAETSNHGF